MLAVQISEYYSFFLQIQNLSARGSDYRVLMAIFYTVTTYIKKAYKKKSLAPARIPPDSSRLKTEFGGRDREITDERNGDLNYIQGTIVQGSIHILHDDQTRLGQTIHD